MKNWIIALLILVVPLVAYYSLDKNAKTRASFEVLALEDTNKPKVIKFYSPMCLDCRKLDAVVKEVMPKYSDKLVYQEFDGQSSDKRTQEMIKTYNVNLVPTMIFLQKDGMIYKKTEGYMSQKELVSVLNAITK